MSNNRKKIILIIIASVLVLVLGIFAAYVIHNLVSTNHAQEYLHGKIFIAKGSMRNNVYVFEEKTLGREYFDLYKKNTGYDINVKLPYILIWSVVSDKYKIYVKEDKKWGYYYSIEFLNDGTISLPIEFVEASMDEVDILRKQTLCYHEFGSDIITIAPTCTDNGEKSNICNLCGYSETQIVPVIEHEFGQAVTVSEATCSSGGEVTYTCNNCSYTKSEQTEALEHNYVEKICTVCGAEKQPEKVTDIAVNTWYKYGKFVFFQNCRISKLTDILDEAAITCYPICQDCHIISETPSFTSVRYGYPKSYIYTCKHCSGKTIIKFEYHIES